MIIGYNDSDVQDSQKLSLSHVATLSLVPRTDRILGPLVTPVCGLRSTNVYALGTPAIGAIVIVMHRGRPVLPAAQRGASCPVDRPYRGPLL
eukprot:2966334-Pyramimonas_sp.AAC.1